MPSLQSRFQLYTYQRIDEALTNDRTSPPQGWETANNSYCPNRYRLMEREESSDERRMGLNKRRDLERVRVSN